MTNYTCGHETRTARLGKDRFDYPENHIEADNRLSWLLGRLDKTYGDNAFYVHLKRDERETARSYARRYSDGIMKAYRGLGILMWLPENSDPMAVSLDYCHTVNSNIELFLKDKSNKMEVSLENIDRDFVKFWKTIGAEGDLNSALNEFKVKYNASNQNYLKYEIERFLFKLKQFITKFLR